MKQKKIPMRSCVVTRERCEKRDLFRIVRTPEGTVEIDLKGKTNGRGAYIKKSIEVINKAKTSKALEKHLEVKIPEEIYQELINQINQD